MLYSRPTHAPEHQVGRGSVAGLIRGRPVSVQRACPWWSMAAGRARSCSVGACGCGASARARGCWWCPRARSASAWWRLSSGSSNPSLPGAVPDGSASSSANAVRRPGRRRRRVAGGQESTAGPRHTAVSGAGRPGAAGSRWPPPFTVVPGGSARPPRRPPGRGPPRARGSACVRAGRCGPTVQFDASVR